jgi:hypothetical protein
MSNFITGLVAKGVGAMRAASVPDQATIDKIAAESAKLVCGKLKGDAEQLSSKVANFIKPELEKSSTIRHITAEVGKEIANRIVEAPEIIIEPMVAALTEKFPTIDPNVNLQGLIDAVTARISANKEPPRTEDVIEERKEIEEQQDKLEEAEEEQAEKKPEIVENLSTSTPNIPLPPPPGAPTIVNGVANFPPPEDALGEGLDSAKNIMGSAGNISGALDSAKNIMGSAGNISGALDSAKNIMGSAGNISGALDSAKNIAESTAQKARDAAETTAKAGIATSMNSTLGPAAGLMSKGATENFANSIVNSAVSAVPGQIGGAEYSFRPELDFSQSTRKRRSKRRKQKKRSVTHVTRRRNKHRKKSRTKRLRK